MRPRTDQQGLSRQYRRDYLKLRSVLHDRVTGLPAFPLLFDAMRAALDTRRRVGILHLEIPPLELVESLYGWQVFDRILTRVAGVLRDAVGSELPERTLLGVSGVAGDRFILSVLEIEDGAEVDAQALTRMAAALRARVEREFLGNAFAGLSPPLTFRVGHALLSLDPFYRFERRVYAAIEEARQFDRRLNERRERSWGEELESIIREAAVQTVFQPVVELSTREILGHEAFARGPRDSLFEMPRPMFALSGRVGVAVELDRLCRQSALRAARELPVRGKLFLNVLPDSLDPKVDPWDNLPLGAGPTRPEDVVLEVSERAIDADPGGLVERLRPVREAGFGLAVDDVGTGACSRATIEKLAPDYLKLDVSLVRDIHDNLLQQEVLQTLLGLSREVGATVIAEGIETEAEAGVLQASGTRYGQGHLFARPTPAPAARRPPEETA